MEYTISAIEPTQITVELNNDTAYLAPAPVKVCVRGEGFRYENVFDTNVFTIDDLEPDTVYEMEIAENGASGPGFAMTFETGKESFRLDVRAFGAKGDGISDDTSSVQAAISACPVNGTVYFGKGTYLCGPVFLKSDIRLWFDEGATLLGNPDREKYPLLPGIIRADEYSDKGTGEYNLGTWEGNPITCFASLITGIGVKNVSIYGGGTIDGNAQAGDWWKDPKVRRTAWRPRLMFLNGCEDIRIQGLTMRNSPSWCIHPYYCDGVSIIDVNILNPENSPNTDGIDPESCTRVRMIGTRISVGDDCIAVKSGKIYMARRHLKSTADVIIRNCSLDRGHGSVTIGSECSCGVRNVCVSRCIFNETDRGLRIKSRRGRGAASVIDDIVFEHLIMNNVRMPFTINMFYFCDPDGHSDQCQCKMPIPVDDTTPEIKSIIARDIVCNGAEVSILAAYGLPERKIGSITLEDIRASFKPADMCREEVPVMMDGLDPMCMKGIYTRNVSRLVMKNVSIEGSVDTEPDADGVDEIIWDR